MTDEQIIKALECCVTDDGDDCFQCPYGNIVYKPGNGGCVNRCRKDALDLINCQKAENEELRSDKIIAERHEKDARDLLVDCTRQLEEAKVEIEGLTDLSDQLGNDIDIKLNYIYDLEEKIETAKSEAIKEFAERLKRTSIGLEIGDDKKFKMTVVSTVAIDNLVKEMTEVQE